MPTLKKKSKILLPKPTPNFLKEFKYSSKNSDASRHTSLRKAVKKHGPIAVIRHLNLVATLEKKTVPKSSHIFRQDISWIQHMPEYVNRKSKQSKN